ncbi:MAG: DNA repair protein RecO [Dehalococcoidia bacterium]|nr:DNA repair protein RecO [Dehalococcoidia bacterium]
MPERPRVYKSPALVLRQRKLGDADKILTLYTASEGKIDVVAKGVRKTKSRLAGHVEPLTQATFLLAKGKSLDIVTQVETIESFQGVRDDLDRLSRGLYCAELLDRFTEPHEPSFPLYRLLLDTLRRVARGSDVDTPVRFYEMALLHALGYRPELDVCVACRRALEPLTNYWSAAAGGAVCRQCRMGADAARSLSVNGLKLLRLLLHGRFDDVARVSIAPPLADELERAMREYVRWVLERDVRSAGFIDTVRQRRPARARAPQAPT